MKEQVVEYPVSSVIAWEVTRTFTRRVERFKSLIKGIIISVDSCPGSKDNIRALKYGVSVSDKLKTMFFDSLLPNEASMFSEITIKVPAVPGDTMHYVVSNRFGRKPSKIDNGIVGCVEGYKIDQAGVELTYRFLDGTIEPIGHCFKNEDLAKKKLAQLNGADVEVEQESYDKEISLKVPELKIGSIYQVACYDRDRSLRLIQIAKEPDKKTNSIVGYIPQFIFTFEDPETGKVYIAKRHELQLIENQVGSQTVPAGQLVTNSYNKGDKLRWNYRGKTLHGTVLDVKAEEVSDFQRFEYTIELADSNKKIYVLDTEFLEQFRSIYHPGTRTVKIPALPGDKVYAVSCSSRTNKFTIRETEVASISSNCTLSEEGFNVFYELKNGSTVSSLYCFTDRESAIKFIEDKNLPKITPICTKDFEIPDFGVNPGDIFGDLKLMEIYSSDGYDDIVDVPVSCQFRFKDIKTGERVYANKLMLERDEEQGALSAMNLF